MNETTATIEKVGSYMKVSKEFMKLGYEADDICYEQLTAVLYGQILAASKEEVFVTVFVQRPTFFDWLFRRTKTIEKHYTIRQLMKADLIKDALPTIQWD